MKITEILKENKLITVYHGDNYNTSKINPALMNNGNNQEGIGIYFGSMDVAQSYGKHVVKATIDPTKFVKSRVDIDSVISVQTIAKILLELYPVNTEAMYYMITDWGTDISEPEDISKQHILQLATHISTDEVRNFQITLADEFGVEPFVAAWNKYTNIQGTYDPETGFYAIIDPSIQISKI